ncbi:hypothetical protein DICPUDRAFT_157792 [Dictyostelium purpureum]|uniref:Uncharacterized protein n=1 Tax=Dictyostelium purpureum TaxID=5786 RepID=F1A006_DICPU|nr:uncharacterized protein DICPUDRAFT_157792 [Dictyostelium purpureum]EGC30473.1 hypothetical protein DICPUDRAFT_157792 [Dictyostelium purpureum]|eukprot:XP_003293002.1 hypothetical protein DICPUDRAFT_157792 [Dictyostelium purpureum]
MKKFIFVLLFLINISIGFSSSLKINCLNENGKPVDWWVIQKQPVVKTMTGRFKSGLGYLYADENNPKFQVPSTTTLNDTNALSHTLNQIYQNKNSDDLLWFMYNDQPPQGTADSYYAHSKGVVAFTENEGFWLIHSVPRFPHDPNHEDFYYPKNEINNGQSFLCVSYNAVDNFAKIAEKIFVNRPFIYAFNMPLNVNLPSTSIIQSVIKGSYSSVSVTDDTILTSAKGNEFQVFAKNAAWGLDLYEDLIQATLKQDMVVTSWRLGKKTSVMPSYCSNTGNFTYDSMNTLTFSFYSEYDGQVSWKYTKDHSKYALSIDEEESYICIGDVNRMYTQWRRGGGSACFVNKSLWNSYRDFIATIDGCDNDSSSDYY